MMLFETKTVSRLLVLVFALGWVASGPCTQAQSDGLVISGGTLIDGTGGPPLQNALVVVRQGRIEQVSRVGQAAIPAGARVIDASGKTILPGFIESHVHLRSWHGEMYLANGVSTLMDLGNADEWLLALKKARELGKIRAPRIFSSGGRLSAHPSLRRTDLNRFLPTDKPHFVIVTVEEAKQLIRHKKEAGISVIKVDESWREEDLAEIVKAAHALDLSVVGHVTNPQEAIRAGIDCIIHMYGIVPGTLSGPDQLEALRASPGHEMHALMDPATFPALIKLMVDNQVFLDIQPFLEGPLKNGKQYQLEDFELLSRPQLQYVPAGARLAIFEKHRRLLATTEEEWETHRNKYQRFLREFSEAGGKFVVGTDTVVSGVPGATLRREIIGLVEGGVDTMKAIQAATSNAAELYRLKDLGTLEAGKLADIQIVDGDPFRDLESLKNVETLIIGGEIMDLSFHADYDVGFERPYAEDGAALRTPTLASIQPKTARLGSGNIELTVRGRSFDEFSLVLFDGIRLPTRWIDRSTLKAVISSQLLQRPGTFRVSVGDPRFLGKGSSNYYGFVVSY